MDVLGFRDGFKGLAEDRSIRLRSSDPAGILTVGGTILGTSRDKPHRMIVDGKTVDMIPTMVRTYERAGLDALVCISGGGTQKNALRLARAGLDIVTASRSLTSHPSAPAGPGAGRRQRRRRPPNGRISSLMWSHG